MSASGELLQDGQASLQANKATFFFRLERELEKVNIFYLQKEAEVSQHRPVYSMDIHSDPLTAQSPPQNIGG